MTTKTLIPNHFSWILPDTTTLRTAAIDNTAGTKVVTVFTIGNNVWFSATGEVAGTVSPHRFQDDTVKPILSVHARGIQEELRARWPSILERARALRNDIPDPVQAMVEFLNNLPGDDDRWREIVEEPYG